MTEAELRDRGVYWQKRLRLQDWDILFFIVRRREFDEYKVGHVEWSETTKAAVIQILDEGDYEGRYVPFDQEEALVHELLHLHLACLGIEKDDRAAVGEEQVINALAKALVALDRKSG